MTLEDEPAVQPNSNHGHSRSMDTCRCAVSRFLIAGIKRSAYVQDARRNIIEWESQYRATEQAP